jgi:hypothetical protein
MATSDINKPSEKYLALEKKRLICRHLKTGIEAVREAKYLRRHPTEKERIVGGQSIDPYQNRVDESRLTNMFSEAVDDAAGRAFAKPAKTSAETPAKLEDFLLDVDGQGSDFQVFGKEVAETSVAEGIDFVLVDYPSRPGDELLTEDQEKALHLAPFWRRYSPANVIDWKVGKRGRNVRILWVRLREWTDGAVQVRKLIAGNPDALKTDESRYVRFEVWAPVKQTELEGEWTMTEAGFMRPQVDIPLTECPSSLAAPFMATPPYLDLAHLTIAHYRKMSALDNSHNLAAFPVKYAAGFRPEDFGTGVLADGPENFFISPNENASINIVEPTGEAWDSLRLELDRMESKGKELSAAPMVTEATVQRTATDAVLAAAGRTSKLQSWVLGWQNAFNSCLYYTAIFLGIVEPDAEKGWGAIELNGQFLPLGSKVEAARLAHERNIAGKLSDESTHEALVRAEVLPETLDFKAERDRIDAEGLTKPTEEDRNAPDMTGNEEQDAA